MPLLIRNFRVKDLSSFLSIPPLVLVCDQKGLSWSAPSRDTDLSKCERFTSVTEPFSINRIHYEILYTTRLAHY